MVASRRYFPQNCEDPAVRSAVATHPSASVTPVPTINVASRASACEPPWRLEIGQHRGSLFDATQDSDPGSKAAESGRGSMPCCIAMLHGRYKKVLDSPLAA
jgi:hypothetical protein